MRSTPFLLAIALTLLVPACAHPPEPPDLARTPAAPGADAAAEPLPLEMVDSCPMPPQPVGAVADFGQVLPILEARCNPCHFPGGSMYDRLPFDRAATIRSLGTELFTRIKDPAEQALILRFLSTPAEGESGSSGAPAQAN